MPEQRTITVYKFEELSEKAKEHALDKELENYDSSFDSDCLKDEFVEDLKTIGISADKDEFNWSAERGREWFFCCRKKASIEDVDLFLKYCNLPFTFEQIQEINDSWLTIETTHYAGTRCENYITAGYTHNYELTERLQDKYEEFLKRIEDSYEYSTSRESLQENLEINDYRFDEFGNIV